MECCLRKLFLPQSFFKRWPLKETFEIQHIAVGRDVGLQGWGNDGDGEGGGEGGWGEALIEVLNKTGIVTFSLVIIMHFTRRNRPKSR